MLFTRSNTTTLLHIQIACILYLFGVYIDGLVQERRNSSALAMELRIYCSNRSIWSINVLICKDIRVMREIAWTYFQLQTTIISMPFIKSKGPVLMWIYTESVDAVTAKAPRCAHTKSVTKLFPMFFVYPSLTFNWGQTALYKARNIPR